MEQDKIVNMLITMVLVGILVPIGLLYIINSDIIKVEIDGVNYTLAAANPLIGTLLNTILPIMIIIQIILMFVPKARVKVFGR